MRFQSDNILDLRLDPVRLGTRQVDLVDDRHNIQIVIQRQIDIGQRLRLNALRRIHDKQRTLARSQTARYLIIEIDMPRRVDQIENIFLPVLGPVHCAHGLRLDGDAPLPFQVHIIQHLGLHFTAGQKPGFLNDPVCQRRLSVVNMGYNAKISDFALIYYFHNISSLDFCFPAASHPLSYLTLKSPDLQGYPASFFYPPPCSTPSRTSANGSMALNASCPLLVWAPTSTKADLGRK